MWPWPPCWWWARRSGAAGELAPKTLRTGRERKEFLYPCQFRQGVIHPGAAGATQSLVYRRPSDLPRRACCRPSRAGVAAVATPSFSPRPFSRDLQETRMPHTQTGWKSPAAAHPDTRRVGRHAAKRIGIETRPGLCPGSMRASTVAWSETNWAADGTLFGGVGQAGFADDLPGTSNSIAACGHRTGVAGLFGFKFGAFEARKRRWRWRREPLRPLNSQGTRVRSMAGVSQ